MTLLLLLALWTTPDGVKVVRDAIPFSTPAACEQARAQVEWMNQKALGYVKVQVLQAECREVP